jgi:hypothetical protein
MKATKDSDHRTKEERRKDSDRRKEQKPIKGPDRRKAERRAGERRDA